MNGAHAAKNMISDNHVAPTPPEILLSEHLQGVLIESALLAEHLQVVLVESALLAAFVPGW